MNMSVQRRRSTSLRQKKRDRVERRVVVGDGGLPADLKSMALGMGRWAAYASFGGRVRRLSSNDEIGDLVAEGVKLRGERT